MARPVRIEFPGAMYHVMARGNRRENIVRDDEDRRTFLRTLEAACERTGFRVHAFVLMSNHYHLLLETPEANLSAGMGWLQNAFTRRINVRHRLWGRLFGDRYKAILIEPGNCFWALLDYIHLNPVRAGMVKERNGIESYPWSSLPHYLLPPRRRPAWLETGMGLVVSGCSDTAKGRREFLETVEARVDWRAPGRAGKVLREGRAAPQLATHCSLKRGWFFGSERFKERLLRLGGKRFSAKAARTGDGYSGEAMRDHGEMEARRLLQAGLEHFQLTEKGLVSLPKGDRRKALIAGLIQERTCIRLDWITAKLGMGSRSHCCRMIRTARHERDLKRDRIKLRASLPCPNVNKT